jgi:sugar (pentulose or hexulose) kinase
VKVPRLQFSVPFACRLAIEELAKLGALSQIRGGLCATYDTIANALIADVITLVFNRPVAKQATAAGAGGAGGVGGPSGATAARNDAAAAPVSHHPRIAALLAERHDVAIFQARRCCRV